ncbi:MAG: AraC family transcriptional regulator [Opitutaceae bacterium]|nr:AraC family transcriptional regulator [Opitutaceae bacterium]
MPRTLLSFARYMTVSTEAEAWGVVVKAGGCIINEPGETYPPAGHPSDHAFTWEHGRVLGCWQVVVITEGEGFFDAQPVRAGDVIFVTPGRWHRYRPSAQTGWTELWVELEGDVLARLTAKGVLTEECCVLRPVQFEQLKEAVAAVHREIGESAGAGRPAELGARAMRVLGLLTAKAAETGTRLDRAVKAAERVLAERLDEPPSMPALARKLGVNYASFRREFARRVGMAPRQYLMRLRLERAQRMIGTTPFTLEAIAEQLGFSSAFHLSASFKKRFGVSPAVWRRGAGGSA